MLNHRARVTVSWALGFFLSLSATLASAADPLPSWQPGEAKERITTFVEQVTHADSPLFVPAAQRIATFDNDGTLWSEQPLYFQAIFALDRVRDMAADHPEWKSTEPFKSAVAGDMQGLMSQGLEKVLPVLLAPHSGMPAEDFAQSVRDWLASARHPTTGLPYTQMVFQPMLELMDYLRDNDFKVYIVSGGGVDFLRVFAEAVYGIPPEQVVGTTLGSTFTMREGIPTIIKGDEVVLIDDKAGKPVGIYRHIGRRPLLAAGNSDGDLQMLQYTTIPRSPQDTGARLGLIIRHTDGEREFAYDRESHIGRLDTALSEADARGWLVVDMQQDWKRIYPPAP